jgi:hypothetical protein
MPNCPYPQPQFELHLPHRSNARVAPFPEGGRMSMQDIGNNADTELRGEGFSFG